MAGTTYAIWNQPKQRRKFNTIGRLMLFVVVESIPSAERNLTYFPMIGVTLPVRDASKLRRRTVTNNLMEQPTNLTLSELVKISGLKYSTIYARIKKGHIKATRICGYLWVVEQSEVARMRDAGEFRNLSGKRHDLTKSL